MVVKQPKFTRVEEPTLLCNQVSGAWVFRGTRMPVATVFKNLETGASIEDIMEWFDLTREQVTSVLDFAARSLEPPAHR
jgi:uncharacterized protein (DUF433 family)